MAEKPWMKWYPRDWRADQGVRMCSLAARGLWIDLLGYMHEATPYGHLIVNGIAPSIDDIAQLVGHKPAVVKKALDELKAKLVCGITAEGVIYSRRMLKDKERADEGREHVNKRWADREPNRSSTRPPTQQPTTQRPEARGHIPEAREDSAVRGGDTAARDEAKAIIAEFTQSQAAVYGPNLARAHPHHTDLPTAEKWLKSGASAAFCRPVFDAVNAKLKAGGYQPRFKLSSMDQDVASALAARDKPMPDAQPLRPGPRLIDRALALKPVEIPE